MATIVAEALLSASVEVLLDKIISREFVDFFRRAKLDNSLLEKLKITLLSLQAVLNDAEEKQITNPAVKEWLVMLQDAVFDAEDLLDEVNTEALRCRVKAEYQGTTVSSKVRNILSSPLKHFYRGINSKIQVLFDRLEYLRKQKLGLKEGVSSSIWHGTPTSSVVDESSIYGRDSDRKKLKEFLLLEDAGDGGSKIGVISIVGMGGLGKTTLAKLLYNDPQVNDKFDLKGWAYISKDFDVIRVTKTLLESITPKTTSNDNLNSLQLESVNTKGNDTSDLNTLQVKLQQSLSHKKFLLVLDDVWDGNYVNWNSLKDVFNVGKTGSKVIITTRDERVALAMQTFLPVHYLTPLQSDECWSLLAKHAFGATNSQQRSNLEVIGKQIAEKCDGLPLAAISLGGLLRTKLSQDDWNNVLKSNIWEMENVEVQPALLLSYHYLPAPLKRCFAYCSIFPKNSILEKNMVVQLWIAEGLVHQPKSQKSWETIGEEYFDELVSRSLIHRQSVDGEGSFEMHDLVNDLATMVSSPYCIRLDDQRLHEKARHFSYNRGQYDSYSRFDKFCGLRGVRTFLVLPLQEPWQSHYSLSDKVVRDLLPTMKHLRTLSLSNYRTITKLPNSIGNLIYLRYLNLSYTRIERLPSETCNLYNLQTLLLFGCHYLSELPEDMGKLVNLRQLDISNTRLKKIPLQIARLQNLQTLSDFVVSKQCDGLKVIELGKFPHLQGKLSISALRNVTNPSDARQANLKTKGKIEKLELYWNGLDNTSAPPDSHIQKLVLEQLRPSTNMKKLTIDGYGGSNFPNWLGDSSFGNMVSLRLCGCAHCSLLPSLGQLQSLKELHISQMASIKSVGAEFYGSSGPSFQPFASLETLLFWKMPEWEEWKSIDGIATQFPSLRHLSLEYCPKLKANIPSNLPSLITLKLLDCPLLVSGHPDDNSNIIKPLNGFIQWMLPLNSLHKLWIEGFPYLVSFPREGLPKTLQSLALKSCEILEFLPDESLHNYTSLEDLEISNSCNTMTSFKLGSLPVLKSLYISHCKNLKSIIIAEGASQTLSFLRSITILHCDEMESFSWGTWPTPNLIHFEVRSCSKLPSLPKQLNTLTSLQELQIEDLPNLQCSAIEDLPINLRELTIGNVGGTLWNTSWCLSVLEIKGHHNVKELMKMGVPLLPTSLVTLRISHLNDIKCLDGMGLHHLTSLQNLQLSEAPNLKTLPEEGLPSSLSVLCILNCPLLEASLWRKRGKEWRKIAHISSIVIDRKVIT